jgi:hypothetical protein
MIIVLVIGPKVRSFKSGQEKWILMALKIRTKTSVGGEVKPSVPCSEILLCVKGHDMYEQIHL